VLDIESGGSTLLYEDSSYSEPVWVDEDAFFFLKSGDKGVTSLLLGRVSRPTAEPTEIQNFGHSLSNLQILKLKDGTIGIALTGLATPSGDPYTAELAEAKEKESHSSARVYTKLFVRHWDAYVTEEKSAIWYGLIENYGSAAAGSESYALSGGQLVNLLRDTGLESPVPTFGGTGDFALGPEGIVFVSRDPDHSDALTTITNLYYVPLKTYAAVAMPPPKPLLIKTGKLQGYSASPTFSPDGSKVVFTRMQSKQYESDKPRLLLIPDLDAFVSTYGSANSDSDVTEYYATEDGKGGWDARPDSILWNGDGSELFVTAELRGRNALFRLPSSPKAASTFGLPHVVIGGREYVSAGDVELQTRIRLGDPHADAFQPLQGHGSVVDVRLLGTSRSKLFVTMSSQVDNSLYTIIDPGLLPNLPFPSEVKRFTLDVVSSQSRHGSTFGLSRNQLGEIWFQGAGDYKVHALVVRPSNFYDEENKDKKWPLALLIHGGPQGAWADSWSTRWNPAVFAEQGYIVVTPNPTGSTSYGMALQDGIQNNWGGRPYEDIVKCVDYVEEKMPYVDMSRAVALGASYGGYMISKESHSPTFRRHRTLLSIVTNATLLQTGSKASLWAAASRPSSATMVSSARSTSTRLRSCTSRCTTLAARSGKTGLATRSGIPQKTRANGPHRCWYVM
jgi:dipeptidyl aminopeptidase/acylaminoacyl peptidase